MAIKRSSAPSLPIILAAGAAVLFLVIAFLIRQNGVFTWEQDWFYRINGYPGWLTVVFLPLTMLASMWMIILISGFTWLKQGAAAALKVVFAAATTYGLVEIAKSIVSRPRPIELLPDVAQRELFVGGLGFPSGHTAFATVLGIVLWRVLPQNRRWLVPVWIITMGFSRLYLGVHFPLDIIGGFLIGVAVALVTERLFRVIKA